MFVDVQTSCYKIYTYVLACLHYSLELAISNIDESFSSVFCSGAFDGSPDQ